MTIQDYAAIGELVGSVAVVISLIYVGYQIRLSTRVNSAASRHAISEFALEFSKFNADHADRLARVMQETELGEADHLFRWWCHMMVMLHAETYYHHHQVGMMPQSHWQGYVKYVSGYLQSPGMKEFWPMWARRSPGISQPGSISSSTRSIDLARFPDSPVPA